MLFEMAYANMRVIYAALNKNTSHFSGPLPSVIFKKIQSTEVYKN